MPRSNAFSFSKGNAKVGKSTLTFSLPAGHTCPFADLCLAKANKKTGKLTDGKHQAFRCFSASTEAAFPTVRSSRWKNLRLVKSHLQKGDLVETLTAAIPKGTEAVRIHVGGDFFSQAYFDAWLETAKNHPQTIFYAYTKSIPFWTARLKEITPNFRLTASMGGKADTLAGTHQLPTTIVVKHPDEAKAANLEIDHDDSHPAAAIRASFALLIHGQQRKGSPASVALQHLRQEHIQYGYRRAA